MLSEPILSDVREQCVALDREYFKNRKVLVTGASGLIGSYLLAYFAYLNQEGCRVDVYAQTLSRPPDHVRELLLLGGVAHLSADLSDSSVIQNLPEFDCIIHAAGYAQPMLFMANPAVTLTVNVTATLELLKRLKSGGSFLFVSSAEVYCGLSPGPFREDVIGTSTPYHPRAAYIEGKRCGETVCAAFRSQGVRSISVRLGDVYGPGTRIGDKRALNTFIGTALLNREIRLLDQGQALRTYCYVADAIESMLAILISGKEIVYNVGGHSVISIADLARQIGEVSGASVLFPEYDRQVSGAPEVLQLDLSRLDSEFGKPEYIGLAEGLRRTIAWQRLLYQGAEISSPTI